jgi:sigma-B regulation protein RsbU (phosphoserine phosphatase)
MPEGGQTRRVGGIVEAEAAMMIDYVQTYHKLEQALEAIEASAGMTSSLSGILQAIIDGPGPDMGITACRLYRFDPETDSFVLIDAAGPHGSAPLGFSVPRDYAPIQRLLREGFVLMEQGDPEFDASLEGRVGVERFAAIRVGDATPYVVAFTVSGDMDPERAVVLLGTVRHVINLKMVQGHLLQDIEEARRIQLSLLPQRTPEFHGFEFATHTAPAEDVGGDLYDFLRLNENVLGVAIGDSCGHGLPAALMARDVVTGLRVVLDVDYRMSRGIERLNRVVSRSALASRFISLLYVEFEPTGNIIYCNAGHPPGLLWRGGRIHRLRLGGPVLGPVPSATYERGFERFTQGSALLLYTDGIPEARSPAGSAFGVGRLERLFRESQHLPAQTIVDRIIEEVDRHAPGPRQDDQTLVVVKRPV